MMKPRASTPGRRGLGPHGERIFLFILMAPPAGLLGFVVALLGGWRP